MTNAKIIENANKELNNGNLKGSIEALKGINNIDKKDAEYLNHLFTFKDRETKLNELVKPEDDYNAEHHLNTMDILREEDKEFEKPGSFDPEQAINLYKDSSVYAISDYDLSRTINDFEERYVA